MNIEFIQGQLFVDGKEVDTVIFKDGTTQRFPIEDKSTVKSSGGSVSVKGNNNITFQGVDPGSIITISKIDKADFR